MISSSFSTVINHLLAQEPWARNKLARHAGKIAHFDAGVTGVRVKIAPDGLLEAAAAADPANVTVRVKLSDLPFILQNRDRAFSYVRVEGDADFANAISQLSQTLHWEAEEDLARWVGDIAAVRMVEGAKTIINNIKTSQKKIAGNVAEYFLEENPMLVRPLDVSDFAAEVAKLRDDVERLTKRIEKLKPKNGS